MSRAEASLASAAPLGGLLFVILTAACAAPAPARASEPPETAATQAPPVAPGPQAPPAAPAPEPSTPGTSAKRTIASEPTAPASAPPATSRSAPKPASPAVEAPAKAPAPPASARDAARKQSPAPASVKPAPLDVKALETRLKETNAIGVFTKLAIKNQVDDLLDQFRAYYEGRRKTTLAELRRPYDGLVLKIVALLQDADPSLAGDVVASREAIWGILADRTKFTNL